MKINLKGLNTGGVGTFGSYDNFTIYNGAYSSPDLYGFPIDGDVWSDHSGNYKLQLSVDYFGHNYLYETDDYYWEGSVDLQYTNTKTW
jgi:hypothetical protein